MTRTNALDVWTELDAECGEAVAHYGEQQGQVVLQQGAANFDKKYDCTDAREKPHYRTDYYVSEHGYMKMHLNQNLCAIRHCFPDKIPRPLIFVDFGCGPMTAGIALAEILSHKAPGYRLRTVYFGMDASRHMVDKANSINREFKLFDKDRFVVVQDTQIKPENIPQYSFVPSMILVCLSFVLAPKTLKLTGCDANNGTVAAKNLAKNLKRYLEDYAQGREMRILYLNPVKSQKYELHKNWLAFQTEMCKPIAHSIFRYTYEHISSLSVQGAPDISLGIIRSEYK